ncbi:MAG: sulfotransferase domain-containing protein [Cyanobacteria bacterium P01_D01_bin.44]
MINDFALIIGAMKCGTTSLFKYLVEHPQICPCEYKKEPDFFGKNSNYQKGFQWYRDLWDYDSKIHKIGLEASTSYTKLRTAEVADRIFEAQSKFDANFHFIYIMRDPIERIESHYTHGLSTKWGQKMMKLDKGIDHRLIEISRYAKQIDEYYKRFLKNNILLLNFEDLKNDPSSVLKKYAVF